MSQIVVTSELIEDNQMKYLVYEWHTSKEIGRDMTVEEVMALGYAFAKFNVKRGIACVTNCCDFKTH